jgi:hypothetical protein
MWGSDMSHVHLAISRHMSGVYTLTTTQHHPPSTLSWLYTLFNYLLIWKLCIYTRVLTPTPTSESYLHTIFTGMHRGANERTLKCQKPFKRTLYIVQVDYMPSLDKCGPSYLNKFISRARMLQWRITQTPKLNTRFLTRRWTRLRALFIALQSVALCQCLLCKISDHIILTSGSNARRRIKSHYISVNNCKLFVKPRSLEPSKGMPASINLLMYEVTSQFKGTTRFGINKEHPSDLDSGNLTKTYPQKLLN